MQLRPVRFEFLQLFDRLSLSPVALQPNRLRELSRQYDSAIVLPPEEDTARKPFDLDAFLSWKRSKYGKS